MLPWDLQLQFWGYEIWGEVADDLALLAERHGPIWGSPRGEWWDSTAADLARISRYHDDGTGLKRVEVPEHWALPGVTELRMRWDREFNDIVKELEL